MRRHLTAGRLLALGLVLAAVVLALVIAPSSDYIFLPDRAHPVAPQDARNFVDSRWGHRR